MKVLTSILIGLLVVGCGKGNQTAKETPKETPSKDDDKNSTTTNPVKELTAEEREVVGGYQSKYNGNTLKYVFLENGLGEWFLDGRKEQEFKWAIVNGEIHAEDDDIFIYKINDDLSITYIAIIRDGKRDDSIKFADITFKKIK